MNASNIKPSKLSNSNGWILCHSKSNPGRTYYFNKKTGKSSWTKPQINSIQDIEPKNEVLPSKLCKSSLENTNKKGAKRKSGEADVNVSAVKRNKSDVKVSTSKSINVLKATLIKKTSLENGSKVSPSKKNISQNVSKTQQTKRSSTEKFSPVQKNSANRRLEIFRASLNAETPKEGCDYVQDQHIDSSEEKCDTSKPNKLTKGSLSDLKSLNTMQPLYSDNDSPSSPHSSQFFAANKILISMKAQLPDEYLPKTKQKNTYADIEEEISNQTAEYPTTKHPNTPPQFSEASKLVSAIKSKLSYNCKEQNIKNRANNRLQLLKNRLSNGEHGEKKNDEGNVGISTRTCVDEKMDCEESKTNLLTSSVLQGQRAIDSSMRENLVFVVDTNVFIHELNFIKNALNSHVKGFNEKPIILVPWRVINELDKLKDSNNGQGAICKRARAAMDYLYKSLPENSGMKGQSLRDSNCHIYPCEVPDDEILNCCLQQKERAGTVILLSKDKNLCNKAVINDIKCMSLNELESLLENKPQHTVCPELEESVKICKEAMQQLFSVILETEMKAKYDNLWLHVLFKPPPWSLLDALECILKHWIAVFSEVFPRIDYLISDLKNCLKSIESKDSKTLCNSEVTNFKDLCLEIAKKCQIIPDYMELAKKTCERLERRPSGNTEKSIDCTNNSTVIEIFEMIWTIFSSYCAKISTGLGLPVPDDIEDKLQTNATLEILLNQLHSYTSVLNTFSLALQRVLTCSEGDEMYNLTFLEQAFKDCLTLLQEDSNKVNVDNLRIFCSNSRNMLEEAYVKFKRLTELLEICKNKNFNVAHNF